MQPQPMQVAPGARVEASDGFLGTVDRVMTRPETGEPQYLVVWRAGTTDQLTIPMAFVEAVLNANEVRLRATIAQVRAEAAKMSPQAGLAFTEGDALHISVAEERLVVGKRTVQEGEVRLTKTVETYEDGTTLPLQREDVTVQRIPVNRPLTAPVQQRVEGDTLIIPIMQEVLVVQKQLMLVEEVHIRKNVVTEQQQVRETLRRERVEVENTAATTPPATYTQPNV